LAPAQRRRRFQFSLRTLFIVTGVAGVFLALTLKEAVRHIRATRAAGSIQAIGGLVHWNSEVFETLWRDQALTRITDVFFANPSFPDERWAVLRELPQHSGLQVEGAQFTDASLSQLQSVANLRYLVLKNTGVTDEGVAQWARDRPEVHIMFGYPGDSNFREIPPAGQNIRSALPGERSPMPGK